MKKYLFTLTAIIFRAAAMACEACKKQQPKFLQNITHGPGPTGPAEWFIVGLMVLITIYVLVATAKCIFRPVEKRYDHIKKMIFNDLRYD